MTAQHNLVIASNALPVKVSKKNGKLVFTSSSGGLATAMSSLEHEDKIWVGWPGIAADELTTAEKKEIKAELAKYDCYPIHLTQKQIELYYEGYSNDTLWPMFHYFQSYAHHNTEFWQVYQEVNALFANTIQKLASKDSVIWIHDYHLMTLPALLRKVLPSSSIGFFLHIPFPSYEIFRLLPERKELLEGILGADLIGFHIYDYARHFISSCLRLLGISSQHGSLDYNGRMVRTESFPIGIDYAKFRSALENSETTRAIAALGEKNKGVKLIISVDRLDYTKGIPERLEAFRLLLEKYPGYREAVKLVMIAVPSRTEVETYQNLREQIEQTVSRINGEFGTVDWAPISYQFQNRPFHEIVALYAAADIALVTPIRDGMNLVAKEFVASQQKTTGVLILSEMTGAADELPEAIMINPNDTQSLVDGLHSALQLPKREQQKRMKRMQKRLKTHTVQVWASEFLETLESVDGAHKDRHKKQLTRKQYDKIVKAYGSAKHRLILLDYDGTLRNFVPTPNALAATPSLKLRWTLRKLAKQPNTQVAIVSGRPRKALQRWFRGIPVLLAAEHGAWKRYDGKWSHTDTDFKEVKGRIREILAQYASRTAGAEVEEKDYAMVWHYRNVAHELAFVRSLELMRELEAILTDDEVQIHRGNKIIEVKPNNVSKGYVAADLEASYPSDFILCAGDDYTDEDMFKAISKDAISIKVGPGDTRAKYQISDVAQMTALLEDLSRQK